MVEKRPALGSARQNWGVALRCQTPISVPRMKNASVITMRVLPPPTVNSVPEPQPPPSCMPTPKMNAPATMPRFIGCTHAPAPPQPISG